MEEKIIMDIIKVLQKHDRDDLIDLVLAFLEEIDEDYEPPEESTEPPEEFSFPEMDEEIVVVKDANGFLSLA